MASSIAINRNGKEYLINIINILNLYLNVLQNPTFRMKRALTYHSANVRVDLSPQLPLFLAAKNKQLILWVLVRGRGKSLYQFAHTKRDL
ncbi:hypothetical protein T01_6867 [Trichinella spiralis]|uniref:Uncharacterized protein n=1 Tax=Trichinella spiralis TaxID=6334 RepID=A0A0V1AQS3_TRISP|nr:hypothetical protein T01_6867 [Trichinella spiralis]